MEEKAYHLLREWRNRKQGTVYALRTILTQAGVSLDTSTPQKPAQPPNVPSSQPASKSIIHMCMYKCTYMYIHVHTCTCISGIHVYCVQQPKKIFHFHPFGCNIVKTEWPFRSIPFHSIRRKKHVMIHSRMDFSNSRPKRIATALGNILCEWNRRALLLK